MQVGAPHCADYVLVVKRWRPSAADLADMARYEVIMVDQCCSRCMRLQVVASTLAPPAGSSQA